MPNDNRPTGLSPVKHLGGANWNQQTNRYVILSTDTGVYGTGDCVTVFAGGDADGTPAVTKTVAGNGNAITGVIVGIEVVDQGDPLVIPSTKTRNYYVNVVDDPTVVFAVQSNNSGAFATSNLNANANIVVANPSGISPFSGTQLNYSTAAATQALQLKILGLYQFAGNTLEANAKVLVKINQHSFGTNTAGVA